jgi:hypothetical protein
MIELVDTKPSQTSIVTAFGVGAAMLASQFSYPVRVDAYETYQVRGTHSDFMDNLAIHSGTEQFAQRMAAIYDSLAQRQERLDAEFEAAIFDDLDSLYEA